MANKITIDLEWEYNDSFSMTAKQQGAPVTVIEFAEAGQTPQIWSSVADICNRYFANSIEKIGKEMKGQ